MTALRAERYSQAVGLSTRSSAPEAMLRTITSCVRSAASSRSPTRAAMNDWSRWRVAAQEEPGSGRSSVLERWALLMGAPSRDLDGTDELTAVWTQQGSRSSSVVRLARASLAELVRHLLHIAHTTWAPSQENR